MKTQPENYTVREDDNSNITIIESLFKQEPWSATSFPKKCR